MPPRLTLDAQAVFQAPTRALLEQADAVRARGGGRLTPMRRLILGLILESDRPMGAYHILDQLKLYQSKIAPPTVYRVIDFLLAEGLIHRIERLSAFVGCAHRLSCHAVEACTHRAQFLICTHCGKVVEHDDTAITTCIAATAQSLDFVPTLMSVEVEGVCAICHASCKGQTLYPPAPPG